MTALVIHANALRLPLADASVDLIVTSPPYFAQRSYRDGGEHYEGQLGSESHPQAFLEALWAVMSECWRVLKPTGVCFVNLGDKRAGSGGHNNSNLGATSGLSDHMKRQKEAQGPRLDRLASRRNAPDRYIQTHFGRRKSKQLLPHRFAIGCQDGLADPEGVGWIVSDYVWSKLNGLPESVQDRCRDSHEYIFQLTKSERWYAAMDEVREPYAPATAARYALGYNVIEHEHETTKGYSNGDGGPSSTNPLGKLPPSVWPMASEPLRIPDWAKDRLDLPDHFAAFPTELARRCILGWSPSGICSACGEGRRPVVVKDAGTKERETPRYCDDARHGAEGTTLGSRGPSATITGSSCACPEPTAPTKPAVVLDVFGGTGTTAMVARSLGRYGVSVDLSADYCRLARWRIFHPGAARRAVERTNQEAQGAML